MPVIPAGNERIMVVDDEKSLVDIIQTTLEGLGYTVVPCTDAEEALKLFQSDPDHYDLVITDLTMPHMTGLELIQSFFTSRPKLPVILCTGFSELVSEDKAEALGIQKFLTKPVLRADLAKAVRAALDAD